MLCCNDFSCCRDDFDAFVAINTLGVAAWIASWMPVFEKEFDSAWWGCYSLWSSWNCLPSYKLFIASLLLIRLKALLNKLRGEWSEAG